MVLAASTAATSGDRGGAEDGDGYDSAPRVRPEPRDRWRGA